MFNTFLTWKRGEDNLQQHIHADIKDMDVPEAKNLLAHSPTSTFWIFTNYAFDIKKDVILITEAIPLKSIVFMLE